MSTHGDDLDLLLSLQDRVLETPPSSPSPHSPGYLSDDGSTRNRGYGDMSVFRSAVKDCLNYEAEPSNKPLKSKHSKSLSDVEAEKFSGLRIQNMLVSKTELSDRLADIRFVRLTAIKTLLSGDTLSGCWATIGVLCEKGKIRTSSTGKPYSIWEFGCLDETNVSVFMFGNTYQKNSKEEIGTVFALFNCEARKNAKSKSGFTLTVFSSPQVLKLGTSADFGQCKSCNVAINKRSGIYCKSHKKNQSEKYTTKRSEFMGGNLRTAFSFEDRMKANGVYMVENESNVAKVGQATKVHSVEGLRKALSNAGKVTNNAYSQGIRFLSQVAGKPSSVLDKKTIKNSDKRKSEAVGSNSKPREVKTSQQVNAKRVKIEKGQTSGVKVKQKNEKTVELEFVSSDDESESYF